MAIITLEGEHGGTKIIEFDTSRSVGELEAKVLELVGGDDVDIKFMKQVAAPFTDHNGDIQFGAVEEEHVLFPADHSCESFGIVDGSKIRVEDILLD